MVWRRWRWRHACLDLRRCGRAAQPAGHGGWRATAAGASSPRRLSVRATSRRARVRMDRDRRRSDRRAGVESNEIHARRAGHVPRSRCREDACGPGGTGLRAWLRKKRHLKTGRNRGPGGLMRPRSASGTPVPAGLDSCSGVCPRGWLRCERPASSPPRRRGGSRTLPRCEVSSLAPSCHCAPALPGLFFCEDVVGVAHRDVAAQQKQRFASARSLRLARPRTHCRVHARIFSTACSLRRDAACLLLTCLVRSVYVPGGRGVAFGRGTDSERNTAIPRTSLTLVGLPMGQWVSCVLIAAIPPGHCIEARRPPTAGRMRVLWRL